MKKISPANIEHFFRRLAAGFTQHPDEIKVDTEMVGKTISFQIRPLAEDTGCMIGSAGVMHKSFRIVLTAFAASGGMNFHLSPVVEPKDKTPKKQHPKKELTCEEISALFNETCQDLFEKPFGWAWDSNERRANINLMIAKNEHRHVTDAELGEGLSRIFNAIGHKSGLKIYVFLERSKTSDPRGVTESANRGWLRRLVRRRTCDTQSGLPMP